METPPKRLNLLPYWIAGLVMFAIVVAGLALAAMRQGRVSTVADKAVAPGTPRVSPSLPAVVQPVDQPTSTPAPAASSTPVATAPATAAPYQLPDSAQAVLKSFYAAYVNKDRERLAAFFTPDTTSELISLHSRLFKGIDPQGNPGGPTLFSSNSASQYASAYVVTGFSSQGSNWQVGLQEQRMSGGGQPIGPQQTEMVLVPSGTGWLIDSYFHKGSAGKYDGFLVQ